MQHAVERFVEMTPSQLHTTNHRLKGPLLSGVKDSQPCNSKEAQMRRSNAVSYNIGHTRSVHGR